MFIDSRLVIQAVKEHPCLHDQSSEDFNNRAAKVNAWTDVSMKVFGDKFLELDQTTRNQVCTYVQKRWRHLRDSYVKAHKTKKPRPYVFSGDLSFLVITPDRTKKANMEKEPKSPSFSDEQETRGFQTPQNASASGCGQKLGVTISGSDLPPDITRRGKKPGSTTEFENLLLNIVKTNVETTPSPPDPDEMFFLSQMPHIKALSPADLLDFKCKFMDLLKSYSTFYD